MLLAITTCVWPHVRVCNTQIFLPSGVCDFLLSACPQIFLYDCTEVSPFSLLFFGGDITIQRDEDQETVAVDQWIVFRSPARIAHLVKVGEDQTSAVRRFM